MGKQRHCNILARWRMGWTSPFVHLWMHIHNATVKPKWWCGTTWLIPKLWLGVSQDFPHHREHSFQTTGIFHAFASEGGYNINSFILEAAKLRSHGQNTLRCQQVCGPAQDRPHPPVTCDLFARLLGKISCLSGTTRLLKSTPPCYSQARLLIAWGCQLLFLFFSASHCILL